MSPDDFRLQLNALVQNLRNVSWLVQKQKAELKDFTQWYTPWQEKAAADPVMRWIKRARNRVVKEADLELLSQARAELTLDWLREAVVTLSVPPRTTSDEIAARLRTEWAGIPGVLTIERQWLDAALPGIELLSATAQAFAVCSDLVATAHSDASCDMPDRDRECTVGGCPERGIPACMSTSLSRRSIVALDTGREYVETVGPVNRPEGLTEDPYGEIVLGSDAIGAVHGIFDYGRRVLSKDGYHQTYAWLFRGGQLKTIMPMTFPDQATKYLAFKRLGEQVGETKADGVVIVGEVWMATIGEDEVLSAETKPARERPDRVEGLKASALTRDGRRREVVAEFGRDEDGGIIFAEVTSQDDHEAVWNMMIPVLRAWERMDPSD